MSEWIENILIAAVIISAFVIIIGGVFFFTHFSEVDYNEKCMRDTAVKYCESNNMSFYYYTAGSLDSEYFKCIESDRVAKLNVIDYSGKELDYCMNKDAYSKKYYKSKWELRDVNVGVSE